jgi:hypothetical protein
MNFPAGVSAAADELARPYADAKRPVIRQNEHLGLAAERAAASSGRYTRTGTRIRLPGLAAELDGANQCGLTVF